MQYKLKVLKINSDENIKIHQFKFNRKGPKILVTGGVHGNESNGMLVCMEFINYIKKHSSYSCQIILMGLKKMAAFAVEL